MRTQDWEFRSDFCHSASQICASLFSELRTIFLKCFEYDVRMLEIYTMQAFGVNFICNSMQFHQHRRIIVWKRNEFMSQIWGTFFSNMKPNFKKWFEYGVRTPMIYTTQAFEVPDRRTDSNFVKPCVLISWKFTHCDTSVQKWSQNAFGACVGSQKRFIDLISFK